ncbi:caspase family protein [Cucumibacter marinus]|uniref:caspase family protein n=1 Tax=Cucumibacter marinus TaxID=1121252 RepID=UPI0004242BE7|nr:caspase family protein [Cucumibacter marinus]
MDAAIAQKAGRLAGGFAAMAMLVLALTLVLVGRAAAATGDRVALVIGNSAYSHVSALPNPANDAADMASALERVGFEVDVALDQGYDALRRRLLEFAAKARGADFALVFYAGHGIEIDKQNYLVPVDAELATDISAQFEAVPLDMVMQSVSGANKLSMVLLDACRNNPFAARMERTSSTRSIGRGLSPVEPSSGTLVGYASEGGSVASDGDGRNSPYTEGLLTFLEQPGLEVNMLFRRVRDHVMRETGNEQRPFVYGSLPGESLYFVPPADGGGGVTPDPTPTPSPTPAPKSPDQLAWEGIKDTESEAILQAFIDTYPDSIYAVFARARLVEVQQTEVASLQDDPTPEPEPEPEPLPESWYVAIYNNMDFYGGDLVAKGLPASTMQQCAQLCADNTSCNLFTFNDSANRCFVKRDFAYTQATDLGTSGFMFRDTTGESRPRFTVDWQLYTQTDMPGGDVDTLRVNTLDECFAACDGRSECRAFTFSPSSGKEYCFIKGDFAGAPVPYNRTKGVISGKKISRVVFPDRVFPASRQ